MKIYNLKSITSVVFISVTLLLTSCVGDNLHPVNPTEDDLTPTERLGNLFPTMLYLLHNSQENNSQHIEQMVGNQYGGYMVTTNNWQGTNFGTFNPPAGWIEAPFSTVFIGFYSNFQKIIDVTERKGHIYAWASIIRVAAMLRITDTYGPIPYSKMGYGKLEVEYDSVQDIYHYMIEDLDNSIIALTKYLKETSGQGAIGQYDKIFNGDFNKWIKFANSLKLRMAVRIAAVDTDYAKKVISSAINDNGGTIEINADNAFLPSNDNPYYKASHLWGDLACSAVLSSYMNGFKDPRRIAYMTKVKDAIEYRGVRMGIKDINKDIYSNANYFSKPAFTKDSPLLVFCAAETAFLKAEAALKGWIAGGDAKAKEYYERGIVLSMEQHNISPGEYLTGKTVPEEYRDPANSATAKVASPTTVNWDDSGITENTKLEKIITQKWLANYPLGFEAWCDHRRTGFPQFFTAQTNLSAGSLMGSITNTSSRMARRLPYPQLEYSGNNKNVQKAVSTLLGGTDDGSVDIWWAKKH